MTSAFKFRVPDQLVLPWSPQRTVSVARAAEMLDCSHDTIVRMIESGDLKGYQLRKSRGSPYRVLYDSVLAKAEELAEAAGVEKRF